MDFLINLLILLLVGYILGSERADSHNLIGIRTVTLILIGSFIFTYMSTRIGGDPARIVAQVVTGTGFIGAGIIFKDGIKNVHNLKERNICRKKSWWSMTPASSLKT